jgi:Rrf2 family iron-sulfur cluster assembly transcriptional regulator
MRLASHRGEEPLTIPDIANGEGLSLPHVGKIMGILKESGLVESVRGRSGGYVLSIPAEELTLSEIFRALDNRLLETSYCEKGSRLSDQCVHAGDCSILPLWEALIGLMDRFLKDVTLADLEGNDFGIVFGNRNGSEGHVIDSKELEGSSSDLI